MSDWIKCSDRLPEHDAQVLVYRGDSIGDIFLAECLILDGGHKRRWLYGGTEYFAGHDNITHWTPLPNPPTEEA